MAWYECLYGGGGGDTTVHPVLIGQFTINVKTTVITRTLSESIDNYKYLLFGMKTIDSDSVWLGEVSNAGYTLVNVDYFKNNTISFSYCTGSSGSGTFQTLTMNYVSDTTFTTSATTATSRTLYVYGIKDMPHGHWNETVLWTNPSPTTQMAGSTILQLSDDFSNYDYVKLVCRASTSDATEYSAIIPSEEFSLATAVANTPRPSVAARLGDYQRCRTFYASPNGTIYNQIGVNHCYRLSSTSTENTYMIPTQITGLKFS